MEKGLSMCKVMMDNSKQNVSMIAENVHRVVPGKGHAVIIVMGEQKGQTGTLIGIDNEDGIVKMDSNLDIKILDREHLAKYRK
jgi:transcription elongation factor SPT5